MNLETIRKRLFDLLNKEYNFHYYGMRGQTETFRGRIVKIYPRVFLIKTCNQNIKCFSYSDFATKLLKIL